MNVNYQSVTLNANEQFAINTPGKVFICDTATGPFELRAGDQAPLTMSDKRSFGSSTSPTVSRWSIKDTSGAPNTIVFGVSMADVRIETSIGTFAATVTTSGRDASTYTKGSGVQNLTSGNSVTYTGLDGSKVRRAIRVQCLALTAGSMDINDGSGNLMARLAVGGVYERETNGSVQIFANGGDVTFCGGSTFYS